MFAFAVPSVSYAVLQAMNEKRRRARERQALAELAARVSNLEHQFLRQGFDPADYRELV